MKNILVNIEFNEDDEILLYKASEIASAFDSKVWLLHITAPDPDFIGLHVGPQYIREERASEIKNEHKQIQLYSDKLRKNNINTESLLIQGPTVEMILFESKKLNIDLIIIGHHDHNIFYKAFFESVSSGIIKKSKVPILMIPLE